VSFVLAIDYSEDLIRFIIHLVLLECEIDPLLCLLLKLS